jgi:hypothetical protein
MPRTPRSVGAYGSKRGKERQRRRRDLRAANPRVARALEEARRQDVMIDVLVDAGVSIGRPHLEYRKPHDGEPVDLVVIGTSDDPVSGGDIERWLPPHKPLVIDWNLSDAIRMLDDGYTPEYVARRTRYDLDIIEELA